MREYILFERYWNYEHKYYYVEDEVTYWVYSGGGPPAISAWQGEADVKRLVRITKLDSLEKVQPYILTIGHREVAKLLMEIELLK